MLRLFQTIREKLLQKGKFRTYLLYAIGEIALVMIGILLALQVNNWNELRKEKDRELDYLQRLEENLLDDIKITDERINFYKEIKEYGNRAIAYQEGRLKPGFDNWDILVAYFQASQIWPLILNDVTYEELKSSGELDLIRSVELRGRLSTYYRELYLQYETTIGINPLYRERIRSQISFEVQDILWENCHSIIGTSQVLIDCDQPEGISEVTIEKVLRSIKTNENLRDLRFWMTSVYVGSNVMETLKVEAIELTKTINKIQAE